jgi:translocation and assembly module TamB
LLIKGWGVESTWRGALNFKGTLKEPALVGKLKVGQGEFNLFGPKFKITNGEIIFSEEQKMTPVLAVRAESKAQDLNAIISVNGPASSPKFALTSQPDLPQDEILSRLLFKEGTANLSPYQALKLANIIGKFNGAPLPLLGQFEQIASTLGFDSFEIDANAKQGASPIVKFGKRLTDTIKATVEEDVEKRKTQGKLQVEVSPHVMLESGLSTEREGNIGLVGKWEY